MASIDRATFEQLVASHLSAAQRFAIRLTGSPHAADDLLQESLMRAARGWQSYRGDARFQTWLFQIIVHAFRDQWARDQRRLTSSSIDAADPADQRAIDPADAAAGVELSERVAAIVSALPPRQREVIVLVVYEKLTCTQAAVFLGLSESNVRANLHYARQRLRAQLATYLPEHCHDR